jgi:hypothetical protein
MPYIKDDRREDLDQDLYRLDIKNVGELTYVLTKLCVRYIAVGSLCYADYAEVIAALENSKLEFYRRALAPYEDARRKENGDVF